MALAWITEIQNHASFPVHIRQTDPNKNPVIDRVESGGWMPGIVANPPVWLNVPTKPEARTWFTVAPNTVLLTSWFVVPWSNQDDAYVYLILNRDRIDAVDLENSGVQFNVGPEGGGKTDYIQFYDRELNPIVADDGTLGMKAGERARIPVGPAGSAASTEGRLNITDLSVTYQITSSNSAGGDTVAGLTGIGQVINVVSSAIQAGSDVMDARAKARQNASILAKVRPSGATP